MDLAVLSPEDAWRLLSDVQLPDAPDPQGLLDDVHDLSPDVELVVRFSAAVWAYRERDAALTDRADVLVERATAHGDDDWQAAGLAIRAMGSAEDDPLSRLDLIARAVVLVEQNADPARDVRVAARALNAASVSALYARLWELGDEIGARASAMLAGTDDHTLRAHLVRNRANAAVQECCALLVNRGLEPAARRALEGLDVCRRERLAEVERPGLHRAYMASLGYVADPATDLSPLLATAHVDVDVASVLGPVIGAAWRRGELDVARELIDLVDLGGGRMTDRHVGWVAEAVVADMAISSLAIERAADVRRFTDGLLAAQEEARRALLESARTLLEGHRRSAERDHFRRLSHEDALTGLSNRRRFDAAVKDRLGRRTVMLVLDLDDFKSVNDRYGHGVGDDVLREVARSIRAELRAGDVACRLGGDEFVVVLDGGDLDVGRRVARRISRRIGAVDWTAITDGLDITLSIGVAAGDDLGLYREADAALYRAKAAGRGEVVVVPS